MRPIPEVDPPGHVTNRAGRNGIPIQPCVGRGIWAMWTGDFITFTEPARDPVLEPFQTGGNRTKLRPVYNLMHQVGLDLQWTYDAWLLKFEGLARDGKSQHFPAFVSGYEYTFYGVFETDMDIGWLGEYHYHGDGRDADSLFNRDVFMGTRITLNNVQDTTFLGGVLYDHESDGNVPSV